MMADKFWKDYVLIMRGGNLNLNWSYRVGGEDDVDCDAEAMVALARQLILEARALRRPAAKVA